MAKHFDKLLKFDTSIAVFVELSHDAIDVCLFKLDIELSENDSNLLFINGSIAILIKEIKRSFEAGQLLFVQLEHCICL